MTIPELDPVEEAAHTLGRRLAAELDGALREAISARIGTDWKVDDLRGRLVMVHNKKDGTDTYGLDGVAILRVGQPELSRVGGTITATRSVIRFKPKPAALTDETEDTAGGAPD